MEVSKEVNQVLDKLAEILGNTGGEIVSKYTEYYFYSGIKDFVMSSIFLVMLIIGVIAILKNISAIQKYCELENDRNKPYEQRQAADVAGQYSTLFIVIGIVACTAGLLGFLINLGSGITNIAAPEAVAIRDLLSQIR